jgi:methionyl-tRNA formyltransferase
MKILLFADGAVGERITRYLLANYAGDLAAAITVENNEIAELCRTAGIDTLTFRSTSATMAALENIPADLGILAWWPKIIRRPLLALPRQGFINTHPSLLPYNRGKHYNFWALVEQAPFGVTLHEVTEAVDAGRIVAQSPIPYDWTDTGESLYRKAQEAMFHLFAETYPRLRGGGIEPTEQNLAEGSFHLASELEEASRISLDKCYSARDLLNLLRARTFPGHPACWFEDGGDAYEVRVEIKRRQQK